MIKYYYIIILLLLLYNKIYVIPSDIPSSSLPMGWTSHIHEGKTYYYNHKTGASQWNKPDNHHHHQQQQQQQQHQREISNQSSGKINIHQIKQSLSSSSSSSSSIRHNRKITTSSKISELSNDRLLKELKSADQRIDDLNNMIDNLENDKNLLTIKLSNETILKESIEINYNDTKNKYDELLNINNDNIIKLKELTLSLEKEIEEKDKIFIELELLRSKFGNDTDLLNTPTDMRLRKVIKALKDKNKELMDAYEEIGKLEADLHNVAGSSIRRLTKPSFFGKLWGYSWNPLGLFSFDNNNNNNKDKNNDEIFIMNRTIHGLYDNLTAMNNALESKDDIIQELSEQLEEYEEEADKRRDAYVALKEGITQLQEENIRLEEVLDARDIELIDMINQLNITQILLYYYFIINENNNNNNSSNSSNSSSNSSNIIISISKEEEE